MIIELPPAAGTVDLPASVEVIELEGPRLSELFNFRETFTLVDESDNTLVDENDNTLVASFTQTIRVEVIELGV